MASTHKVACLLGNGFEDSEFRIPFDRLRQAGLDVEVIGFTAARTVTGKNGLERVEIEKAIDQVSPGDYAALLIPGGHSPDLLRGDPRFVDFVKAFDATGRPIAAVCHGPQLLLAAGLVKGRKLTAWPTVQRDLELAGAVVRDEPVVVDRNWITSRRPDDLEQFSEAIVKTLR